MFEVVSVDNISRWNEIVHSMSAYDFYHLAAYHQLDKSGEAFLLYYEANGETLAIPFIKRPIQGTKYYDVTSIYGYGGPLSKRKYPVLTEISLFHSQLKTYFDENKIVTAFSTFHPLLDNQSYLMDGIGKVMDANQTIAIDLRLSEEMQREQYARSTKYQINRLKREGIFVKKASSKDEIDSFIHMYKENMDRVHATSKYYFSPEYFYFFLNHIDSLIFLAYYQGEVISGSLCAFCHSIMQAHLNATKTDLLSLSPLKLVLDEARKEGVKRNMDWLHLGGGREGKDDSLFEFKYRFSQNVFLFRVWKYIHNEDMYRKLIQEKYGDRLPCTSFFPLYRYE